MQILSYVAFVLCFEVYFANLTSEVIVGYLTRQPTSNDPIWAKKEQGSWLTTSPVMDEFAAILNGMAKRCKKGIPINTNTALGHGKLK